MLKRNDRCLVKGALTPGRFHFANHTCNFLYTYFLRITSHIHAPVRKKRARSQFAPWLTVSLKNLMRERDILKKEAERSPEKWSEYKQLRNKVTREMRDAIRDYYHGMKI